MPRKRFMEHRMFETWMSLVIRLIVIYQDFLTSAFRLNSFSKHLIKDFLLERSFLRWRSMRSTTTGLSMASMVLNWSMNGFHSLPILSSTQSSSLQPILVAMKFNLVNDQWFQILSLKMKQLNGRVPEKAAVTWVEKYQAEFEFLVLRLSQFKVKSSETCPEFLTDIRLKHTSSGTFELWSIHWVMIWAI